MAEFKYIVKEKHTVWTVREITITSDSESMADGIAENSIVKEDVYSNDDPKIIETNFSIEESELDPLFPSENNYEATVVLYKSGKNGVEILTNNMTND